MLASLAAFFTGTPIPREDARSRLKAIAAHDEVKVLYLFAEGNLNKWDFCSRAGQMLLREDGLDVSESENIMRELGAVFDEATADSLSYVQLRSALDRPMDPASAWGASGAVVTAVGNDGTATDIFSARARRTRVSSIVRASP